jgi:cytoskeleton protein RodZ
MLREARESMHVDIAVLAAMLKVPEHKLLALEEDRFEALPDLTFARALAASVCRTLQIDPAPVLAKFPQPAALGAQRAHAASPINAPYRTGRESSMTARTGNVLQSRYIWLVLAILLGAVVLALLPNLERLRLPGATSGPASVASAASAASAPADLAASDAQPAQSSASDAAASSGANASLAAPAAGTVTVAVAPAAAGSASAAVNPATAAAPVAPTAAPTTPAASAPAGTPVLRLVASKDSWVQVREAGGKTLISRTIKAGETVDLDGQAPYKLVVGNTQGLTLSVRGQAFDFATVTKTTTARFDLN